MHGLVDQDAAIVEDIDGDTLRQRRRQLLELGMDAAHHLARVGPAQGQHQTLDRLPAAVARDRAVAGQGAEAHLGDIGDPHRLTDIAPDHDGSEILQRLDRALAAHQQHLLARAQTPGAVIAVVRRDRGGQVRQTDPPRGHARIVRHHLEAGDQAAERVHIGHAGHGAQGRADGPVEEIAASLQGEIAALDAEHEHLAQRRGHGREPAFNAVGQIAPDRAETLGDLLARPIDVSTLGEIQGDVGQGVFGDGAQHRLVWDAEHLQLDPFGDACLHLLGRHPRRLHDDLHLGGGDIREGIDRRGLEGQPAAADERQHGQQHQQPLGQRELDQTGEHHSAPPSQAALMATTPLTASRSAAVSPPATTALPSSSASTRTGSASKPPSRTTNT